MDETKAAIRHAMRRRRRALAPRDVAAAGTAVADAVLALDVVRTAPVLLAYVDADNEIPTGALIASALAAGQRVFLPRCRGDHLIFAEHRLGTALRPGAFGIPEPQGEPGEPALLATAVAVLPLLAWDDAGGRIGRGGGHYDRAFAGATRPRCLIGLAYAFQHLPRVPRDPWDLRLDYVATECGVAECWTGDEVSPNRREVENDDEQHCGDDHRQRGDRRRAGGPAGPVATPAD
jgi:5-formyltetrahydrofolate cyclo-ligase